MGIKIKSYKELTVWQKSMDLVIEIYKLTKTFPKEELYGLTSQMRRASVSIPSNIAEGAQRNHIKEYINFLYIARSSASELETQLNIAKRLNFISTPGKGPIEYVLTEVIKMLNSIISKLKRLTPDT